MLSDNGENEKIVLKLQELLFLRGFFSKIFPRVNAPDPHSKSFAPVSLATISFLQPWNPLT